MRALSRCSPSQVRLSGSNSFAISCGRESRSGGLEPENAQEAEHPLHLDVLRLDVRRGSRSGAGCSRSACEQGKADQECGKEPNEQRLGRQTVHPSTPAERPAIVSRRCSGRMKVMILLAVRVRAIQLLRSPRIGCALRGRDVSSASRRSALLPEIAECSSISPSFCGP